MLAAPQHGFVFLSMPKTASTSIEEALRPYALIATSTDPRVKHLHYRGFERFLQPWLHRVGFPRDSYEVICLVREPISWLHSWYRYRSRAGLADPGHPRHVVYTGERTFDDFALAYVNGDAGAVKLGRQARFVQGANTPIALDRMYRYEELDAALQHLGSKVGRKVTLERRNVSPERPLELSPDVESQLRSFLAAEYHIWDLADGKAMSDRGDAQRDVG